MRLRGERPQPGHRRGSPVGQQMELPGYAHLPQRPAHFTAAERRARAPEKGRQVHAVAGVDEPLTEPGYARVQPRHFMHYDHRRTGARPVHLVRASRVSERGDVEPWHRIGHGLLPVIVGRLGGRPAPTVPESQGPTGRKRREMTAVPKPISVRRAVSQHGETPHN